MLWFCWHGADQSKVELDLRGLMSQNKWFCGQWMLSTGLAKSGLYDLDADEIAQPDAGTQTWTQHVPAAVVIIKEAQTTWLSFHTYLVTQGLQLFIRGKQKGSNYQARYFWWNPIWLEQHNNFVWPHQENYQYLNATQTMHFIGVKYLYKRKKWSNKSQWTQHISLSNSLHRFRESLVL